MREREYWKRDGNRDEIEKLRAIGREREREARDGQAERERERATSNYAGEIERYIEGRQGGRERHRERERERETLA